MSMRAATRVVTAMDSSYKHLASYAALAALPLLGGAGACAVSSSSAPPGSSQNSGSTGGGSSAGGGASGGSTFLPGGGAAGGSGDIFGTPTTNTDPGGPDAGCFGTASQAEQYEVTVDVPVTVYLPFDMYVIYDQSGSMDQDTPVGTKWDAISAALTGFMNDPGSDGIGMGIGYFPFVDPAAPAFCCEAATCALQFPCGTYGPCVDLVPGVAGGYCEGADSCQVTQYETPDVPIEDIPAVVPKMTASLGSHSPGGGTPTAPALQGALNYAIPWAAAHPDRKTIVVLATDGDPSGCSANSVQDVANVAASGLSANPPVQTFVIGVGSSLTSLNSIAAAGGTDQAFIVDAGTGDPTQQFIDAMNAIRESVTTTETRTETQTTPVPCEWLIPAPPEGETFDKKKVNVDFSAGGGSAQQIGYVDAEGDCANVASGWHYDDKDNPTKVQVCSQTCDTIQGVSDAVVNVSFGCETVQAELR
jgi:hypothetical protein